MKNNRYIYIYIYMQRKEYGELIHTPKTLRKEDNI